VVGHATAQRLPLKPVVRHQRIRVSVVETRHLAVSVWAQAVVVLSQPPPEPVASAVAVMGRMPELLGLVPLTLAAVAVVAQTALLLVMVALASLSLLFPLELQYRSLVVLLKQAQPLALMTFIL
jgi:hypothetical protein